MGCELCCVEDGYFAEDGVAGLPESLAKFFAEGKSSKKKFIEVDMTAAMEEARLSAHFHVDVWPSSAAVRELATQLKSNKATFIYSDLRNCVALDCLLCCACACAVMHVRFLPAFCDTFVPVSDDEHEVDRFGARIHSAVVEKGGRANGRKLDLASWQMAWDRFALAAAMVKMLDFSIAARYKQARRIASGWCVQVRACRDWHRSCWR
jgi:hypothetical protein